MILVPLQAICTFTATLNLPAAEEGVIDEIWQPAVEIDWGQAALEALPRNHQLREVLVHVGSQTSDKQVTLRQRCEYVSEFNCIELE